jgi:hypothetical protein
LTLFPYTTLFRSPLPSTLNNVDVNENEDEYPVTAIDVTLHRYRGGDFISYIETNSISGDLGGKYDKYTLHSKDRHDLMDRFEFEPGEDDMKVGWYTSKTVRFTPEEWERFKEDWNDVISGRPIKSDMELRG